MNNENLWQILFVDDDPETCEQVSSYLEQMVVGENDRLKITTKTQFDEALGELESRYYDIVILDVRLGSLKAKLESEAGTETLNAIKERRFIPVIFYTALPKKVSDLETPLIRIVEKTEGVPKLLSTIKEVLSTNLPFVNRALLRHLGKVQRDYMWEFVANNWEAFGDTPDRTSLAYLLARRLAKSLDSPGIQKLAEKLGDSTRIMCSEDNVHPMRYYIVPPLGIRPMAGDVIKEADGAKTKYMVLITPSCDFVQDKADHILFAYCTPLRETQEYIDWKKNPDDPRRRYINKLLTLLKNGKERFFFLPGIFNIPDLIVDYQKVTTFEPQEFTRLTKEEKLTCVASLDSPYCEELCARFSRYFGRLGTPDLNTELIIKNLRNQVAKADSGNV